MSVLYGLLKDSLNFSSRISIFTLKKKMFYCTPDSLSITGSKILQPSELRDAFAPKNFSKLQ